MAMFSFTKAETGEPSISCHNAPDCTKLRLKFQNFPGGDTPGAPFLGRGTPPSQTPAPLSASRLDSWFDHPSPLDSFILPPETNGWIKPWNPGIAKQLRNCNSTHSDYRSSYGYLPYGNGALCGGWTWNVEYVCLVDARKIPFLAEPTSSFIRAASLRVKQWLFIDGQFITRAGDVAQELYYIKYGQVCVCTFSGFVLAWAAWTCNSHRSAQVTTSLECGCTSY